MLLARDTDRGGLVGLAAQWLSRWTLAALVGVLVFFRRRGYL